MAQDQNILDTEEKKKGFIEAVATTVMTLPAGEQGLFMSELIEEVRSRRRQRKVQLTDEVLRIEKELEDLAESDPSIRTFNSNK